MLFFTQQIDTLSHVHALQIMEVVILKFGSIKPEQGVGTPICTAVTTKIGVKF